MKTNIVANLIGKFWSILSNFLFIPLYIHYLGFESYSIISFTLVIAGLMAVLDGGLTAPLSREFARHDKSQEDKIRVFKTLESSYFIIIGLCIILIFSSSGIIANKWLNLNTLNKDKISLFLKLISFDVGFQLLLRFYIGGLLGLEKQIKANLYQIGWGIFRNGFVVMAIFIVPTLEMFFIWQTISTVVFAILIGLSLRKELIGQYIFDFRPKIEKSVLKYIWRFSLGMMLISLVASLNTQIDKLAISKMLPVESLGYYTLAVSLSMGIFWLVSPISTASLPRFTALYSNGKTVEATKLFRKISLFVSILVFSLFANMAFFAKELIWVWTGKIELAEHTFPLIPIIAFAYSMLSLQVIPFNIAIANGHTKLNNIIGLISILLTMPGYWLMTKYYGALGAAYIFCGVQFVTTLIYLYFINKKFIKRKNISSIYLIEMLFPLIFALCVAYGFSFIPTFILRSRIYMFIWIGVSTLVTFITATLTLTPLKDISHFLNFRLIKN